nr:hypothetical protein [Tanacetum cinerariifolium]
MKAKQTQINNVKNELRNKMKNSIQASMSNQTNKLKNMIANFFQMNTASTSGSGPLPSNTIANPKGGLKAITTRSGIVLDGPSVPMPPTFINPEEDEHVEETLTDPELDEFSIKVPPPLVQKPKPPSQRNFMVHQRDPLHPNIPYPSRMHKQKQQEKDEKMIKALLSNKEKLLELENTPLNENCSAVILKKLPEKLGDPGKFLIPCSFNELKCKALADLARIARDVFVSVGKLTFLADFVIVDYESDLRVSPILGRPFLWTARALINVHGEEMILHDGNDDLLFDIESDLKEIEYFLNHDPIKEIDFILKDSIDEDNIANLNDNLFDTILEMFTNELALDYSSPPLYDDYDDDSFKLDSDTDDVYNDPFDSKGEKIEESKLLIDELDLPRSSNFLSSPEYDSFLFKDFSEVDALPSTDNEDKKFSGLKFYSHFNPKIRKKFSNSGFSLLKEFILLFYRNYLIGAPKLSKSLKFLKARWRFFLTLLERTFVSWMFRVFISIPLERINSRDQVKLSDLKQALRGWISRIMKTRARGFVL